MRMFLTLTQNFSLRQMGFFESFKSTVLLVNQKLGNILIGTEKQ